MLLCMNTTTKTEALAAIAIADANVTGNVTTVSSAMVCLEDARKLFARGDFAYAHARALRSLAYSVGVLHKAWRTANGGREYVQLGYQID